MDITIGNYGMHRKFPEANTLALTEKTPIDFLISFRADFIPLRTG